MHIAVVKISHNLILLNYAINTCMLLDSISKPFL